MQINLTTEYALRTVFYLSEERRVVTTEEISRQMSIPQKYLYKILKILREDGIVQNHRGKTGGFTLKKDAGEITFGQIVRLMEGTIKLNSGFECEKSCVKTTKPYCGLKNYFLKLQKELDDMMNVSLKEIIGD